MKKEINIEVTLNGEKIFGFYSDSNVLIDTNNKENVKLTEEKLQLALDYIKKWRES